VDAASHTAVMADSSAGEGVLSRAKSKSAWLPAPVNLEKGQNVSKIHGYRILT
jgi:hypothetical protein